MPLDCAEHGDRIFADEKNFGVANGAAIAIVCERALRAIPQGEHYSEKFLGGIDVYMAVLRSDAEGELRSYNDFEFPRYLFTMTQTTLRRYLSATAAELLS